MRFGSLILMLMMIGCSSVSSTLAVDELSNIQDESSVVVSGWLRTDFLGHEYLYPTRKLAKSEDYSTVIDVVPNKRNRDSRFVDNNEITCVVVQGRLIKYSEERVPTGYLRSKIALIEAESISESDSCVR